MFTTNKIGKKVDFVHDLCNKSFVFLGRNVKKNKHKRNTIIKNPKD